MTYLKQAYETPTVPYDFADVLGDNSIASIDIVTSVSRSGSTLTKAGEAIDDSKVLVKWSGGTAGLDYLTTVRITDSAGDKHELDGVIAVRDSDFGAPVTLEQARQHLKLDTNADDFLVQTYLDAAIGHIDGPDGWLGRSITVQTIERRFDNFGCGSFRLPYPPVIAIESVKYIDTAGIEQTVPADQYEIVHGSLMPVYNASWPTPRWGRGAVRIRYQAGYDGAEGRVLPRAIRAAILLMVGDLYRNRGTTRDTTVSAVPMSMTVDSLLGPLQVYY